LEITSFLDTLKLLYHIFLQSWVIIPVIIFGLITGFIIYFSKSETKMICPTCVKNLKEYGERDDGAKMFVCTDCEILVTIQDYKLDRLKENE